jgi:LysR family transcriptional regulator, regulator of abg operon
MDQIWRLKHFLAVAEAGSVQGAARSLNISQPALSKSLRQLEEHLQAALFDRSARGVVLTPMGQVFYRHAREIQSEWDSSVIEISAARDGAQGELRIGMGPTYAVVFMRRVLAPLAREYPNLRVSVRTGVGALLIPALQAGEISLYAGGLGTFEEQPGKGLEEQFLYDQSNCIVVSKNSDLARQDKVTVAELARHPWVILSYDSIAMEKIVGLFRSAGMAPPKTTISTESLSLALELVRQDGFMTSLPRPLVHPNINPELCPLDVSGYEWTIRSGVTYRSSMRSLAPVKTMLATLNQDVARLGFV